jgi:hypothetical protein
MVTLGSDELAPQAAAATATAVLRAVDVERIEGIARRCLAELLCFILGWAAVIFGKDYDRVFYIFIFFKIIFYRNIFSVSQFTGLYPYRPAGGGRGRLYVIKICVLSHGGPYRPAGGGRLPPNIKAEVPPPAFAANNIHRGKKERRGVREGVATAKLCRIPHL